MTGAGNWWADLAVRPGAAQAAPATSPVADAEESAAPAANWWEGMAAPPGGSPAQSADRPNGPRPPKQDRSFLNGSAHPPDIAPVPRSLDELRQSALGASFGWSSPAIAGARTLFDKFAVADPSQAILETGALPPVADGVPSADIGTTYKKNLASEDATNAAYEGAHPIRSKFLQAEGMVFPFLVGPKSAPGAPAAPAGPGPGLLRRGMEGAGAGAAGGAVYGAGTARGPIDEQLESTVSGAATGALVGGTAGAILPPLVSALGKLGGKAANFAESFTKGPALADAEKAAIGKMLEAANRDGVSPTDALAKLTAWQQAGAKPEMLPDLFGDNFRWLSKAVANVPGESKQLAVDAIAARSGIDPVTNQSRPLGRIGADVAAKISPLDFTKATEDLIEQRSKDATPLYNSAFANSAPVDTAPVLANIDGQLSKAKGGIKDALNKARELLMDGAGNPDTSLEGLHQSKLAIDDLINSRGTTSLGNTAKRAVIGVQKSLLDAMDTASNGEYAQARAAFSGPSKSLDALEVGRAALKEDSDVTAQQIAAMAPGDRNFARAGIAKAIMDKASSVKDGRSVVASFFDNPGVRQRIEATFDNPKDFQDFQALMMREAQIPHVNAAVSPRVNSQTVPLAAAMQDIGAAPPPPAGPSNVLVQAGGKLAHGDIKGTLGTLSDWISERAQGVNPAIAKQIGQKVFSIDPKQNIATLLRMQQEQAAAAPSGYINRAMLPLYAGAQPSSALQGIAATLSGRRNE